MPSLYLSKRDWCYGYDCSDTWNWARWVLFVLFVLGLVLVIVMALRINKKRGQQGREPIRGTAWITPPSYQQTQMQEPPYVPQYTAETNENDMGYYDGQGQFHPNPKAQEAYEPNAVHLNRLVPDITDQQTPGITGNEAHDFQRDFSAYYGNTATTTTSTNQNTAPVVGSSTTNHTTNNSSTPNSNDIEFVRPEGPPPAHVKK